MGFPYAGYRRCSLLAALATTLLLSNACMFIGLSEDVDRINAAVSFSGHVNLGDDKGFPIVVILSRSENGSYPLQAYSVVYGKDPFLLVAPAGKYYLIAFEDKNQDFTRQHNERVGWHGALNEIKAKKGNNYADLTIELRNPEQARKEVPGLFVPGTADQRVSLDTRKSGEVVDVSFFNEEAGTLGMWDPVKFVEQGHSGIYFIKPFDPNKVPVLFVHGIGGAGHNWLYLMERLDRQRFQPWVVQYPSGMRLGLISTALHQAINEMKAQYPFTQLAVVAHSMGGLVARGFVNLHQASSRKTFNITTFLTLSTPWDGHKAASQGVDHAPVAIPSWFDMVPGSPYLEELFRSPLPQHTNYYLLFSHKGPGAGFLGLDNSDGTVSIASQLPMRAQQVATRIWGFDESHVSILRSHQVSKKVNQILKSDTDKKAN